MPLAAVISLQRTFERLQNSCHISLDPFSQKILQFAFKQVASLEKFAKEVFRSSMRRFEMEIRVAVLVLEDAIESHVSDQIHSQSEESINGDGIQFSVDLRDLRKRFFSFAKRLRKMEKKFIDELKNTTPAEEEEEEDVSSITDSAALKYLAMVRLSDRYNELKDKPLIHRQTKLKVEHDSRLAEDEIKMQVPNTEGAPDLLREKAFGQESCPSQLGEVGKKIVEHRDGLPFAIVAVTNPLLKKEMSKLVAEQYSKDLGDLKQDIHSFTKKVKKTEEDDVSSKKVGLSDLYRKLKDKLIVHVPTKLKVVSLVGMPGIGKTTLAKEILEDPHIVEHFDCRAWVEVGKKCQLEKIPRRILAEVNLDSNQMLAKGDEDVAWYLQESLKGRRYLIVLDDVWDKYMASHLQTLDPYERKKMSIPLPDEENGSRVLLTTRLQQVATYDRLFPCEVLTMRLLEREESWRLLCKKIFVEKPCPFQLAKAGKKIAENCEGLPLTIVTVAGLLSKEKKTLGYWKEVAEQKNHQLFMDAYNEMSKVLLPSYNYLSRLLQMCFLYMAVFPQNYRIPRSKLISMWNVDEFSKPCVDKLSNHGPMECLEELVSNSLVMTYQRTIDTTKPVTRKQIKTCNLHSSLWHLANKEAMRTKFSLVLSSCKDGLGEGIKRQRRLSFHNNILFGIKDVYKSMENNCAPTVHSLLCYGPYHQYQVPIYFKLKFLRVLDAFTVRFYGFPMEVLKLLQLRYLALTLDGKLPTSISKLSKLQFLIVNRHLSIKSRRAQSYLPMKIWDMKELQHLQVMQGDLPDPCGASLESLLTLSNVNACSCTKAIFEAIPNLDKLGIQIELGPDNSAKPLSCFDHISHLVKLRSLKFVIVNHAVVPPFALPSNFPPYLRKLSLSGLGYSWKEMSKIALLPYLNVLKLQNYAFRGPEWEVEECGFCSLRSLVIEDTDLVEWKIGCGSFRFISYLSMKHCYKLERIDGKIGMLLKKNIELVDCNPLGVEQMKRAISTEAKISVHSSWNDGELKA